VGHVARMEDRSVLVARHKGMKPLERDLGADILIILKLNLYCVCTVQMVDIYCV
jgi:hypothetical protein